MTIKVGIIQKFYKQNRYDVECFEEGKKRIGFSCDDPEFLFSFLEERFDLIEGIEFWANATPVPPDMLAVVAQMKEIVGVEKCL